MSLINEALKKAQRSRHHPTVDATATTESDGPIVKRAQPKSAKSTLIVAVGGVALVALSIVLTAFWMSRPSGSPQPVTTPKPTTAAAVAETKSPVVVVPALTPPAASAETPAPATTGHAPAEHVAKAAATTAPVPEIKPAPTPQPAAITPAVASSSPPVAETTLRPPAAKPDERVNQFIENLHVMGIRASGGDSKVLMNDRVYRVNDIVDRTLGIKLTKVSNDNLTFTDANGVTYVKYF